MSAGECQTKNVNNADEDDDKPIIALDEGLFLILSLSSTCFPFNPSMFLCT